MQLHQEHAKRVNHCVTATSQGKESFIKLVISKLDSMHLQNTETKKHEKTPRRCGRASISYQGCKNRPIASAPLCLDSPPNTLRFYWHVIGLRFGVAWVALLLLPCLFPFFMGRLSQLTLGMSQKTQHC